MNKKDLAGLLNKNQKDLADLLKKKIIEADEAKMSVVAGKEKNVRKHKTLKRDVAQILTIIREKEIIQDADFSLEKKSRQKKNEEDKSSSDLDSKENVKKSSGGQSRKAGLRGGVAKR